MSRSDRRRKQRIEIVWINRHRERWGLTCLKMETAVRFQLLSHHPPHRPLQSLFLSSCNPFSSSLSLLRSPTFKFGFRTAATSQKQQKAELQEEEIRNIDDVGNSGIIISACVVGVLTGVVVVLFNNAVHEIRDLFWDGIPYRGASWLRKEPLESIWFGVISVPTSGGFIVALFTWLQSLLTDNSNYKAAITPLFKSLAACFSLGTGNSLGPEGSSVEIGANIAKAVSSFKLFPKSSQFKLSLLAAGSAAGISSGSNAAVAGCFFAVESVLWPSPMATCSLTNTTSMVILSAVTASEISEVGLGSEPAFKVPAYDFRSPAGAFSV